MPIRKFLSLFGCCLLLMATGAHAQEKDKDEHEADVSISFTDNFQNSPIRHWYVGNAFDGAMFQTAFIERPDPNNPTQKVNQTATLRFSIIAIGNNFHYDFDEKFGLFTGLGIKNIGWIEKNDDSTTKRRLYSLGVPLALKMGNLQKRHYGFLGGGLDFPINYREKRFIDRGDKYKFNEFWSQRTDPYMPYIFAGVSFGMGAVFKVQYYPGNFFDTDFQEYNSSYGKMVKPYEHYRVNMLYFSLGFDIHYNNHKKGCCNDSEAPSEI